MSKHARLTWNKWIHLLIPPGGNDGWTLMRCLSCDGWNKRRGSRICDHPCTVPYTYLYRLTCACREEAEQKPVPKSHSRATWRLAHSPFRDESRSCKADPDHHHVHNHRNKTKAETKRHVPQSHCTAVPFLELSFSPLLLPILSYNATMKPSNNRTT